MTTPRRTPIPTPAPDTIQAQWAAVEEALHALTLALLANTAALERWTRVVVANDETRRQQEKAQTKKEKTR